MCDETSIAPRRVSSTGSQPDDRDAQAQEPVQQEGRQLGPQDQGEEVDGQVVRPAPPRGRRIGLDVGWQESRYTSPLPSPEDLRQYREMLPDAPERLLAAGEREQAHRHDIETRLVDLDAQGMPKFYAGQRRGHVVSVLLGLGYEGIMALAIVKGYPAIGGGGAAFGLAAMFWALRRDPASGVEQVDLSSNPDAGSNAEPG